MRCYYLQFRVCRVALVQRFLQYLSESGLMVMCDAPTSKQLSCVPAAQVFWQSATVLDDFLSGRLRALLWVRATVSVLPVQEQRQGL